MKYLISQENKRDGIYKFRGQFQTTFFCGIQKVEFPDELETIQEAILPTLNHYFTTTSYRWLSDSTFEVLPKPKYGSGVGEKNTSSEWEHPENWMRCPWTIVEFETDLEIKVQSSVLKASKKLRKLAKEINMGFHTPKSVKYEPECLIQWFSTSKPRMHINLNFQSVLLEQVNKEWLVITSLPSNLFSTLRSPEP